MACSPARVACRAQPCAARPDVCGGGGLITGLEPGPLRADSIFPLEEQGELLVAKGHA